MNDKSDQLTVDEIRDVLSLRFERLDSKTSEEVENADNKDVAFFVGQFKGKCRNCNVISHKARN